MNCGISHMINRAKDIGSLIPGDETLGLTVVLAMAALAGLIVVFVIRRHWHYMMPPDTINITGFPSVLFLMIAILLLVPFSPIALALVPTFVAGAVISRQRGMPPSTMGNVLHMLLYSFIFVSSLYLSVFLESPLDIAVLPLIMFSLAGVEIARLSGAREIQEILYITGLSLLGLAINLLSIFTPPNIGMVVALIAIHSWAITIGIIILAVGGEAGPLVACIMATVLAMIDLVIVPLNINEAIAFLGQPSIRFASYVSLVILALFSIMLDPDYAKYRELVKDIFLSMVIGIPVSGIVLLLVPWIFRHPVLWLAIWIIYAAHEFNDTPLEVGYLFGIWLNGVGCAIIYPSNIPGDGVLLLISIMFVVAFLIMSIMVHKLRVIWNSVREGLRTGIREVSRECVYNNDSERSPGGTFFAHVSPVGVVIYRKRFIGMIPVGYMPWEIIGPFSWCLTRAGMFHVGERVYQLKCRIPGRERKVAECWRKALEVKDCISLAEWFSCSKISRINIKLATERIIQEARNNPELAIKCIELLAKKRIPGNLREVVEMERRLGYIATGYIREIAKRNGKKAHSIVLGLKFSGRTKDIFLPLVLAAKGKLERALRIAKEKNSGKNYSVIREGALLIYAEYIATRIESLLQKGNVRSAERLISRINGILSELSKLHSVGPLVRLYAQVLDELASRAVTSRDPGALLSIIRKARDLPVPAETLRAIMEKSLRMIEEIDFPAPVEVESLLGEIKNSCFPELKHIASIYHLFLSAARAGIPAFPSMVRGKTVVFKTIQDWYLAVRHFSDGFRSMERGIFAVEVGWVLVSRDFLLPPGVVLDAIIKGTHFIYPGNRITATSMITIDSFNKTSIRRIKEFMEK